MTMKALTPTSTTKHVISPAQMGLFTAVIAVYSLATLGLVWAQYDTTSLSVQLMQYLTLAVACTVTVLVGLPWHLTTAQAQYQGPWRELLRLRRTKRVDEMDRLQLMLQYSVVRV